MVLKRTAKKKNASIRKELLNLLQKNDNTEEQGFDETVHNVNNSQEAILIINHHMDIIKTQNEKTIGYIGKQEELVKKYPLLKKSTQQSSYLKTFLNLSTLFAEKTQLFLYR